MRKFIMFVVFLPLFCISVPVLAIDSPAINLIAPRVSFLYDVTGNWKPVLQAKGYMLSYAPPDFSYIGEIDMGTETSFSVKLWEGAAFYVAVQAYTDTEISEYSNIEYFELSSSEQTFTNPLGMEFVYIGPGTFTMGSPEDELGRDSDETQHEVTFTQGYYMQTTEVTQGQWEAVMGSNPSYFSGCGSDCPVENVSFDDIQEFIDQLNQLGYGTYSLPTEAQWEDAARAGSTSAFANGEITQSDNGYDIDLDNVWYVDNSNNQTHPVAQKTPNAWGLYDMHGNASEWVADWYDSDYYNSGSVTDPAGPSSGSYRVLRGGSWGCPAMNSRSASRSYGSPGYGYNWTGFRLSKKELFAN